MADVLAINMLLHVLLGLGHAAVVHDILTSRKIRIDKSDQLLGQRPELLLPLGNIALFHRRHTHSLALLEIVRSLKRLGTKSTDVVSHEKRPLQVELELLGLVAILLGLLHTSQDRLDLSHQLLLPQLTES